MVDNLKRILKNPFGNAAGIFCFRQNLILFIFVFGFSNLFCQAKLQVIDSKKNFGFVKRGELIKNEFEIKNIGNEPLIIKDVEIACSCTTVDFPKQPILPGQATIVTVNFNTTTVYGRQDREVYLNSNALGGPTKLRYKGFVKK